LGLACAAACAHAAAPAAPAPVIRLRVATIETEPGTSLLPDFRAGDAPAAQDRGIVQLGGPITPAQRAALADAGVGLGDYLPDHAYLSDLSAVDVGRLAALPFVHWVGVYQDAWKIDPAVGRPLSPWRTPERILLAAQGKLKLTVSFFRDASPVEAAAEIAAAGGEVIGFYRTLDGRPWVEVVAFPEALSALAAARDVQYIEEAPEVTLRNSSVRWIVQSNELDITPLYANGLSGAGQIVGIIDYRINEEHCAFFDVNPIGPLHRKVLAYNDILGYDMHGTHVAGTVVGDAGVFDDTRGVAYAGRLVFSNLNPPNTQVRLALHHDQGARIHTNSWGNDATNTYDQLARDVDQFAYEFEDSLVLFAVTNLSILRNPENAKNLLAVGATGDAPDQDEHCYGGVGPTIDGRLKPEIFAPGCGVFSTSGDGMTCGVATDSGTSMACPATAGVAMLVRQYFVDGYYPQGTPTPLDGFAPSAALIKAVLLNSAVDLSGVSGYPNYVEGWGRVLIDDALAFPGDPRRLWIVDVRNADGLATGESIEYELQVEEPTEKLKVTLAWTDPPGTPGAAEIAVNNLDLEVIAPCGSVYYGNVFSNGLSVTGESPDPRNNVEQVHVAVSQPGLWRLRVNASAVNVGAQGFALVATGSLMGQLPALRMRLLEDPPEMLLPGALHEQIVRIAAGAQQPVPGSARLHVRFDDDDPWIVYPIEPLGGELHRAGFPAARCGETLEYYITAQGDGGAVVAIPAAAPEEVFTLPTGAQETLFADAFESDLGWSVGGNAANGHWQRGVPAFSDRGSPAIDFDGSGQCYVTENVSGNSDVDAGTTELTSPVLDLTGGAVVSYAYWLADITTGPLGPEDGLSVSVATDPGGSNWQELRRYDVPFGAWRTDTILVGEEVAATATMRFRFSAFDLGMGHVLEAGVDAFRAERMVCGPAGDGDFDDDGDIDLVDFAAAQACFADQKHVQACLEIDMNGDTVVDGLDLIAWVSRLDGPLSSAPIPPVIPPAADHRGGPNTASNDFRADP